jgi:hypothetical protein
MRQMKKSFNVIFLICILVGCTQGLPQLNTPTNFIIEDDLITFTEVTDATNYIILINNEEIFITECSYKLNDPGIYSVKVKAQANGYKDSPYTKEITYLVAETNHNFGFVYSLKSNMDLTIYDITLTNPILELSNIDSGYIVYSNNSIKIKQEYLHTLTLGKHDYVLKINGFSYEIEIHIIDSEDPYLMIYSNYYFDQSRDMIIRFDTFDSKVGVSGISLTEDNFTLTDDKVIVNKDFIQKYFEENPNINMYILTIHFEKGNNINLARIWLHKTMID